jgi:haloacetate dehalogenase
MVPQTANPNSDSDQLFIGFTSRTLDVNGVSIHLHHGGDGPPVLLLHGYPQTHVMWHRVAPRLAERFSVVCPDLRGYGDSDKPFGDGDHRTYAKRTMAQDDADLMHQLGFDRYAVAGHDRGARVALRLALDHPDAVSHLAALDIVPTKTIYDTLDQSHAMIVWRYLFLTQESDLPERLIAADPRWYLRHTLDEWAGAPHTWDPRAVAEYLRCFDAAAIHATCEDYRAGATIDLTHDRADSHRTLSCPTLALCSRHGLGQQYDVEAVWRTLAPDLRYSEVDCGHFLAEERPEEVAATLRSFFSEPE